MYCELFIIHFCLGIEYAYFMDFPDCRGRVSAWQHQDQGVGLETAAVFLVALAFGHFAFYEDSLLHSVGLITASTASMKSTMSLCQNIGLACFVTAVGFIAGPSFFHNLKKNAKS